MYYINGNLIVVLGVIGYLVVRGVLIRIKYRKQKQIYWLKEVTSLLFVTYIYMIVSVTLFPLPLGFDFNYENVSRFINIVPLASIIENINKIGIAYDGDVQFMIGLILRNVGGNILLFMPLGFLVPVVWNKFKSFKNVLLLGLIASISIEILQLLESFTGRWGRITDIDDVIFNVLGIMIGYLIYKFTFKLGGLVKC